ncbi:GTPase ObgE [Bacteroidales bacterium OttesenSCG-928-B11]|nr:GTPase ObgE [Bacteroidales bacterium OttesenSCG-928-E04]MDL2312415.1 GTPase ObgE [Bacteroidales bacterium OttesenSCG-928-B11]MDL2326318.1 GTPase ObgE [Bacteroidales bacterium OttesenSCG-928-A14]
MAGDNFIDYVKIFFRSGKGGGGSAHLMRTAQDPKAGPDGGDGGKGGDVVLVGNRNLWTLLHLRYTKHIFAEDGGSGSSNQKFGKNGQDAIVEVPLGTIARNPETGEVIGEVMEDGERLVIMKGGRGGLGNVHFKSATRQTPRFAQPGEEGVEDWVILELKVLADVGLVGFPNAGKSTLISVLSNAKPKIADYPFTTLRPNLGLVPYRSYQSFVIADIPGIIEGASEGKGLGLRFLRHIERNAILLFLVPCTSEDIKKEYTILLNELRAYNPELMDKKRILAITKCDISPDEELTKLKRKIPKDIPSFFISSLSQKNLMPLKDEIWKMLNEND